MIERLTAHLQELARITPEIYDSFQKHEGRPHLAHNPNHRHGGHPVAGAYLGDRKKNVSRFFSEASTPASKPDRTTIVDGYHKERDLPTLHLLLETSQDKLRLVFSDAVVAQHISSLHSILRTTEIVLPREKAQLLGVPNKTESFIKLTEKRIALLSSARANALHVLGMTPRSATEYAGASFTPVLAHL